MLSLLLRSLALVLSLSFGASAMAQTVTLQDGLNGYAGTADARIGNGGTNEGAAMGYSLIAETSTSLAIRFAIFQSEGGPVPNGATITSASLQLFKAWGPDAVFKASRLKKSWDEMGATWTVTGAGQSWQTAGALGSTDVEATADGQGSVAANTVGVCDAGTGPWPASCWLNIDVTSGVQAFAGGSANHGWKVAYVSGTNPSNPKDFHSSERDGSRSVLRPKLVITYATAPSGNSATLQDGVNSYAGTADTRIGNGGTNEGSAMGYSLIAETSTSLAIRFNIFQAEGGPVPDDATVTGATLSLFKAWGPDAVFKASRLKKSWEEMGLTWTATGAGQNWQTAGAMGSTDVEATADGQGSVAANTVGVCDSGTGPWPASCWLNIDVTSGVQAFKGGYANNGWKVAFVSGSNPSNPKDFHSSERDGSRSVLRPKLTVTWTGGSGGGPTVPTAHLTATPQNGEGPLTVTFNASQSSDGGSPITNIRVVPGQGLPAINWTDKNETRQYTYPAGAAQYTATLTVSNAVGDSAPNANSSRTITVTTGPVPTASFTATPSSGPAPLSVEFDASASNGNGFPITQLRLEVGENGHVETWTNPADKKTYVYTTNGAHTARLVVSNANGDSQEATRTINVGEATCSEFPQPAGSNAIASSDGESVPTFHSMSLYYRPGSAPAGNQIFVRYRRACDDPANPASWKEGWPLWYDARNNSQGQPLHAFRARGSVMYLTPGTKYFFELGTSPGSGNLGYLAGTTWSESIGEHPVVEAVGPRTTQYTIAAGGTETEYKVYDGQNNVIDTDGASSSIQCILVDANYVIVRNFRVRGCYEYGIAVASGRHHVVIEDNDITDWDWRVDHAPASGWGTYGADERGGVELKGNNSQIVVQRNKIYDPHLGSRPWDFDDPPRGPAGIMITNAGRQNVLRYNEIFSNKGDHFWFHDGIESAQNFSATGGPGADSDIYHNLITNVMDDGIEAEGGGRNVRIWGNYIDFSAVGIATSTVHHGPMYVFRNVLNRAPVLHMISEPDQDSREKAFKAHGLVQGFGGGRQYFFHNTVLQQPGDTYEPEQDNDLGHGEGVAGGGNGEGMRETWTRNNVLQVYRDTAASVRLGENPSNNNIDYDLYNGNVPAGTEGHGVRAPASYEAGNGWDFGPKLNASNLTWSSSGNFRLKTSATASRGVNEGTPLANFTYGIDNLPFARKSGVQTSAAGTCSGATCPDMGAHDSAASEAMKFGRAAGQ